MSSTRSVTCLFYDVTESATYRQAVQQLDARQPELLLADVRLQDGDGFDLLAHCRKKHPGAPVILITGYGTVETAVEAIRAGAFDLLTKPLIDEELEMAIERALSQRKVIEENKQLKAQLDMRFGMENIVGHDHRMLRIFDMIDSVADTKATVLITGESGTGKSLIARAIHRRSGRREQAVRRGRLRCPARDAAGKRAVRPRGRAPSPGPPATRSASSCRPTAAPSSSTRSAPPRRACRSSCCACCRTSSSSRSAARRPSTSTPG